MIAMPDLAEFWNELLPGNGEWPRASAAITEPDSVTAEFSDDELAWLRSASARVLAAANRTHAMQELEREAPAAFGRMLSALYDAYYATAAVHAVVERLAERGPREPDGGFDETMLRQVIETRAGKRRM